MLIYSHTLNNLTTVLTKLVQTIDNRIVSARCSRGVLQAPGVGVVVVARAQHGRPPGRRQEAVGQQQPPPQGSHERRLERLVLAALRVVRLALLDRLLAETCVFR